MRAAVGGRLVGLVVFSSAFLLFTIELLVGKAALPRFGGTSAVWTTSLFFFQAALLAGYGYAHAVASRVPARAQAWVHAAAVVLSAAVLLAQAVRWGAPFLPPRGGAGVIGPWEVVAFLTAACGAPFVLLSTTGPLLQHWYAGATKGAPWRFYAVSNAGSLAALVVYPFIVEPRWGLTLQAKVTAGAFLAWAGALAVAVWRLRRAASNARQPAPGAEAFAESPTDASREVPAGRALRRASDGASDATRDEAAPAVVSGEHSPGGDAESTSDGGKSAERASDVPVATPGHRSGSAASSAWASGPLRDAATWVALSAMGTLFLSAVNNVMCQDVAPTPLLWALPLALYLASFIVTFGTERAWTKRVSVIIWLLGLAFLVVHTVRMPDVPLVFTVTTFSLVQLGANLLCHGELYARRPSASRLSAYYLWMAVGGVLGSLAVGFVAPLVFRDYTEFSLGLLVVGVGVAVALVRPKATAGRAVAALASVGLVVASLYLERHLVDGVLETRRNFFGVLRVQEEGTPGQPDHVRGLRHGNILHGLQWTGEDSIDEPTTYYTKASGLGAALQALRAHTSGGLSVEVLGLGLGTIAALLDDGDAVDFVEVNPDVIALAEGEGGYFSVLSRSKAKVHTTLGDARQVLEGEQRAGAPQRDLLVVDVFSGDAVPAHLFTVEAFELYFERLKPHGLLALHVSNRHLKLGRVALGIAVSRGWPAELLVSRSQGFATAATWVVVARDEADLPVVSVGEVFRDVRRTVDDPVVWTDDFQSILHALKD